MWLKLEAPDIWSAQLTRDAGGSLLSKVLILARPTCKLSICNVELMLAIQIACKSDPTQLLKSLFSDVMITSKWRSCQLHFGAFSAYFFWLFVFKIVNPTRPRKWKWPQRPSQACKSLRRPLRTLNHWKSTLTSCRSVGWPNFRTIKMVKIFGDVIDRKSTFR